ncbi:TetR family transcriptional regulator [Zavarzinia sp. CC-PAN008]|uniref:TetR family transcriptional regulator n=1 Tax=Zavarzinia sp. CC-PAN008 TaxID=3243332 RepID=UPI003F749928
MARPRTIDPERLLDAAEDVVLRDGAAGLTIEAVARQAGVTKGGVQYSFRSKEAMIEAMFSRWYHSFDAVVAQIAGPDADPLDEAWAHVQASMQEDYDANAKAAAVLAALMQSPEHQNLARAWYARRMAGLDLGTAAGRMARIAVLATEGVFMLRFFGLMTISPQDWQDIFRDLKALRALGDRQEG